MGIDRRQFLKFLAFIPIVGSRINLDPDPMYRIAGIAAAEIPGNVDIKFQWSPDGTIWYPILEPPFHPNCQCVLYDHDVFKNYTIKPDGRIGGIIIDRS